MPATEGAKPVPYDKYPQMRVALVIMHKYYQWSGRDRVKVFDAMFKQPLANEGLPNGVQNHDRLDSQCRERSKEKNKKKWEPFLREPDSWEEDRQYALIYASIKSFAQSFDLKLPSERNEWDRDDDDSDGELSKENRELSKEKNGRGDTWVKGPIDSTVELEKEELQKKKEA